MPHQAGELGDEVVRGAHRLLMLPPLVALVALVARVALVVLATTLVLPAAASAQDVLDLDVR